MASSLTTQIDYALMVYYSSEYSSPETGLVVLIFQKGDDPIDAINHMMSFLTAVVTSRYPATNNQLQTSSNPRQQATINNGRVTIQPILGRQNFMSAGGASGKQRISLMANLSHYGSDNLSEQNCVVERRNRTLIEAARTMLIYAQASLFLWAEAVATACYTQNQSIIRLLHGKKPYELLHNKLPNLLFFHVFGALCYPTNDSENLGKLQTKANIGIFIGYAPTKKVFRIYNRRTRRIVETIHVDIDELTAMASEQSSLGPTHNEITLTTISSGLVQKYSSSTPYVPPLRNNWDLLFQPMFDELLNPPPSVDHQAPEVITLIADVIPPVQAESTETQSSVNPQDVEEDIHDIEFGHIGNDPLFGVPIPEVTSVQSSSTVVQIVLWYLDSGCSKHMTRDRSQLVNFVHKFLGTVKFGNDHVAKIIGYGDYKIGNVTISRVYFVEGLGHNLFSVYYVEGLGHNLFSVGQFCDSYLEVAFRQHTYFIRNLEGVDQLTEVVATACFTQNRSIIHLRHGKTPYELLHSKLPDLSFFHVFGSLCYSTNDSENLAMASEQSSSGPALNEMTPGTICSGFVQKSSPSTSYVPPSRNDWDLLFQSMFDELLNPPPSVVNQAPGVIAPIAEVNPPVHAD
nr:hypothetical protein [Tanacetum cinerariifolium]